MLAIWLFLLFQPVSVYEIEGGMRLEDAAPGALSYEFGWDRALGGWLQVLDDDHNLSWFANLLCLWCLIEMLRGRRPNILAAGAAALLAPSGLAPYSTGRFFDSHGTNGPTTMFYSVDVWMWSCMIPIAVIVLIHGLNLPAKTAPDRASVPPKEA